MRIVILGHVCIDKNTSENASYVSAGSPAMFLSKIFVQLPDCQTSIITPYGKDFVPYQKQIKAKFYPDRPTSNQTLIYENITLDGVRFQKAHHRDSAVPVHITEQEKGIISNSDLVFISPLLPNFFASYIRQISKYLSKNALKILLPQGYYRSFNSDDVVVFRKFVEADQILPLVDIIILSEQDYPDLMHQAELWSKSHPKLIIIITKAENGAVALTKNHQVELMTTPVARQDIVDSVGAGDVFTAGFGYRYHQTRDIIKAGHFANAIARQRLFYMPDCIKIDYLRALD